MSKKDDMKKPRLILSVKSDNWRMEDPWSEEGDMEFKRLRPEVLKRDNFTCQACSFKSMKWQEVHHLDDNHNNNSKENLCTLCSFCHMVQHIGFAGMNGEAKLIWLPEITQDQLHHIVRAILVAEYEFKMAGSSANASLKGLRDSASTIKAALYAREEGAKKRIGTSNPSILGNALLQLAKISPSDYDKRDAFLAGIRLLPTGIRMSATGEDIMQTQVIPFWVNGKDKVQGPFTNFRMNSWAALLKSRIPS